MIVALSIDQHKMLVLRGDRCCTYADLSYFLLSKYSLTCAWRTRMYGRVSRSIQKWPT